MGTGDTLCIIEGIPNDKIGTELVAKVLNGSYLPNDIDTKTRTAVLWTRYVWVVMMRGWWSLMPFLMKFSMLYQFKFKFNSTDAETSGSGYNVTLHLIGMYINLYEHKRYT